MELSGVYVPLVTPFTPDGEVDTATLERLAREVVADGAAGIVALGTTGEPAVLEDAERRAVLDVCAAVRRDTGTTMVVGAGGSGTWRSAAELAALAAWPEVDAALVPVPAFVRPTEAGVVAHMAQLAARSPVPVIVYHVPHRTARPLGVATLRELAALPGVVGMKNAVPALDADTVTLLADPPRGFAVLAGDVMAAPMLALGAAGAIAASAHLCTGRWVAMVDAWRAGDAARARELGAPLAPLAAALFAEPNPSVIKAVLHATGRIPAPDVRLPLLPPDPATVAAALHRIALACGRE
ncbi:dihydrodipicolinate synthase family protein [Pseudonocardia sp. DSM 110487]|uniref:dihydrodipicolinate synthase family protein n=1 Tax=Pseudonocardia sp. DSM 110487 TaxID=2865833 RepID=UPI001C6A5110|nr:dihydrodipicolinate synthase family protein [Pseudonocardia sp. DSM 110487]QYN39594.1 dihydrodipicolinate synthase family protein [Pseudonocardia sp. DSM 110487]